MQSLHDSQLDFSKIKYNVHTLSENDDCISNYKDLQLYADVFYQNDLPDDVDKNFVMKYLIYTYTPSSPFVEVYTDIKKRKMRVLEFMGITSESQITDGIKSMCSLSLPCFIFRWTHFLKIQSNEVWTMLCVAQERYYKVLETYLDVHIDPTKEKAKNDVVKELLNQIKTSKEDFMQGEKSKLAEDAISFSITSESLNIRPEEYIPYWASHKNLPYEIAKL